MLSSPICNKNYDLKADEDVKIEIILNDGNKVNLLTGIPGITILADGFEFSFEINKMRQFSFNYLWTEGFDEVEKILGEFWNEVQIHVGTELVFDGKIIHNDTVLSTSAGLTKHRVQCVGTEYQFSTSYVKGLTTYVNLTSKNILERVGYEYNKREDMRVELPVVDDSLKTMWLDALTIDGQYTRLFDLINERELSQMIYFPKGKVHFIKENMLQFGTPLMILDNSTPPSVSHLNDTKVNRVSLKYNNVSGSLIKEKITSAKEGKSVKTVHPIYNIKNIKVNGDSSFIKSRKQENKDKKTYSFNDNEITFTGVDDMFSVEVEYWQKEPTGFVTYDDEKSILVEDNRREFTAPIFEQEISTDRYSNMRDIYSGAQRFVEFVNRPQYKINFTIQDANTDVDFLNDFFDLKRYKWGDPKWYPYLKDAEYFVVHKKTYKLKVLDGCESDTLKLSSFKVELELETDQSNRWEDEATRDKSQNEKDKQNVISFNLHVDWDIGDCTPKGSNNYTADNLTTQTTMANVDDKYMTDHIVTKEKIIVKDSGKHVANSNVLKCKSGNNAYIRGFVWYKATVPKAPRNTGITKFDYTDTGTTEQDARNFLEHKYHSPIASSTDYYVWLNKTSTWYRFEGSVNPSNQNENLFTSDTVEYEDHWVKIPVDARIFDTGTNNLATTWDVPTEWKLTGRDSDKVKDKFYFDPYTLKASVYPINVGSTGVAPPDYSKITGFVLPLDYASKKFTNWKNDWYTSLNGLPKDIFDDKNCNIRNKFKTPVTTDSKTGDSNGGHIEDRDHNPATQSVSQFSIDFGH